MERHAKLSENSRKAVDTKLEAMRKRVVDDAIAEITVIVEEDVERNAVISFNDHQLYVEISSYYNITPEYADEKNIESNGRAFLDRITVNYIRHNLTDYDESLWEEKGKVGIREFYARYKCAVLDKIAEAYPKYRKECLRQRSMYCNYAAKTEKKDD